MDIVEEFLEITKAVPCQQHTHECESTQSQKEWPFVDMALK
jgi:hypothetical protein